VLDLTTTTALTDKHLSDHFPLRGQHGESILPIIGIPGSIILPPQYILLTAMAHTIRDKKKLLNRVRRVRGQIEAVERLLKTKRMRGDSQQIAASRGSINGLMSEVLEGHIRFHLVERRHEHKSPKSNALLKM